jgi:sec-independent protein translocase protein TatC
LGERDFIEDGFAGKMSFWDHLEELRFRLIRIIIAIVIGLIVSYYFASRIFEFLMTPAGVDMQYITPMEAFLVYLKIALICGIIVTLPYTSFQIYRFFAPAMRRKEKLYAIPFVFFTMLFFSAGVYFAWKVLPIAMNFFKSFQSQSVKANWTVSKYTDFLMKMFLGFGLVFETPILVFFLAKLGILSPRAMLSKWKYFVIGIFIIAAFITPGPDIFSQMLLAGPLLVLYFLSILVAKFAYPKEKKD